MRNFNSFLDPMPRLVAHRGDSKNHPENTLEAFKSAVEMGVDIIETDVHLTKDSVLVIWHDPTLERNTDGTGTIESHTYEELLKYDAAYTFTKDGGKTFPFRGKGIKLCTLDEALKACPDTRFNVDLKSKNRKIVDEFISVLRKNKAEDRVVCASFHYKNLRAIRKKAPDIMTSITTVEVLSLLLRLKLHMLPKRFKRKIIFQVPEAQAGIKVITPSFIREMHKRDAVIMVWTINDEKDMERLFKAGVDTVMTDDPALLIKVAERMGIRS